MFAPPEGHRSRTWSLQNGDADARRGRRLLGPLRSWSAWLRDRRAFSAAVAPSSADTAGEIRAVAEVTSALILFRDTAQIRPRQIDADRGLVVRLLLVGLPLALVVGYRGKGVLRAMPDAVLAEARVGPFHHSQHC